MNAIVAVFLEYWPVLAGAVVGCLVSFLAYLKSRSSYKTALLEKETENLKLQRAIVEGSYILCPKCGEKIFIKDVKVFTGGKKDEN